MMQDVNDLIDAAIQAISDDDLRQGADTLYELSMIWSMAGLPITSFFDIRKHIIESAESKTDRAFIREKIKLIEREHRERRNRSEKASKIIKTNIKERI